MPFIPYSLLVSGETETSAFWTVQKVSIERGIGLAEGASVGGGMLVIQGGV